MSDRATIFALSSAPGRAGVAVIRISGPSAGSILDRMTSRRPPPRYAGLRRIHHPQTKELLDEGLVLWLPGPRSETGEDMAELQVHGGPAVVRAILQALESFGAASPSQLDGVLHCRLAEPGEFARRAFEAGKMDLTQVEGLGDLIDAETDAQRRQALSQQGGALARLYDSWRQRLIEARALVEAAIDFSDEADVAAAAVATGRDRARLLLTEIEAHLADNNRGEIVRDGFRVVLAGPPNVGKSSLLNALARRDVAIVSSEAGTTRDVIEVRLDLAGYAVVVADTAGIREATGAVELEGIRRTLARARDADLVLWLVDATAPVWELPAEVREAGVPVLVVLNKVDAVGSEDRRADLGPGLSCGAPPARRVDSAPRHEVPGIPAMAVSALTGEGLAELTGHIAAEVKARIGARDQGVAQLTRQRHRIAIEAAREAVRRFLSGSPDETELRAEELRQAADALGRVVGRIDVEDVLGEIFGRFCIGK